MASLALATLLAAALLGQDRSPAQLTRDVRLIAGPAEAADLCAALTPFGRVPSRDDVVSRARVEAEHEARRAESLQERYQVELAPTPLVLAPYDPEEGVLALSYRSFLAGAGGALWLWAGHDAGLPVRAGVSAAERIALAARRGSLRVVLTFTLPEADAEGGAPACGHVAGSGRFSLGVEPYRWSYRDREVVLARGGEGSDRPLTSFTEGARPRVALSEVAGDEGPALGQAVAARRGELQGCYERALAVSPGLDGAYVAEVDPAQPSPRRVRVALDAVGDDGLATCVSAVLEQAVQVAPIGTGRAQIPLHFELVQPDDARDEEDEPK